MLADGRGAVDELQQHKVFFVIREADLVVVAVFQGEVGGLGSRCKPVEIRKEITDDVLVLGVFGLALDVIQVVFGKTAHASVAIAEFLQVEDGDELGQSWVLYHERVGVQVFFESYRALHECVVKRRKRRKRRKR